MLWSWPQIVLINDRNDTDIGYNINYINVFEWLIDDSSH